MPPDCGTVYPGFLGHHSTLCPGIQTETLSEVVIKDRAFGPALFARLPSARACPSQSMTSSDFGAHQHLIGTPTQTYPYTGNATWFPQGDLLSRRPFFSVVPERKMPRGKNKKRKTNVHLVSRAGTFFQLGVCDPDICSFKVVILRLISLLGN